MLGTLLGHNMYTEIKGQNVPIRIWAPVDEVEAGALAQLKNVAALPWVIHHVVALPDVHFGKGATIGSVIVMQGAVSPSAVGVDLGCGVLAARTNLKADHLPDSLRDTRLQIERDVPTGFNEHQDASLITGCRLPSDLRMAVNEHLREFSTLSMGKDRRMEDKAWKQVGTLGGGNHFIEMLLDKEQRVWIVLHSGSRYTGNKLAEYHTDQAMKLPHNADLPDRTLSALLVGSDAFRSYWSDLIWAQRYAELNRSAILELVLLGLRRQFHALAVEEVIACHHNYAQTENEWGPLSIVTRKGAISAKAGEMGVIPGSMGGATHIVRGLGSENSFRSAAHGAGRRMSRGEAKRTFSKDDVETQTAGVECRKDRGIVDEVPGAYKDITKVMEQQRDLVESVAELKGIMVIKDSKE